MNPTPKPPHSLTFRRRALALAAVMIGAAAVPAAADAAVVEVSPEFPAYAATSIAVTDYDHVDNDITVRYDDDGTDNPADDRLIIRDEKALLSFGSQDALPMQDRHCIEFDAFEVRCRIIGVTDASAFLAGGNDKVRFLGDSPLDNTAFAGDGDDEIYGGPSGGDESSFAGDDGNDKIYGSDGVDLIQGGPDDDYIGGGGGDDYLTGGIDDDQIRGQGGADRIIGDSGSDTALYSERVNPVTADLDGNADDGAAGEGDEIEADVEILSGGIGSDRLTGNNAANELRGGGGNDQLRGGGGPDVFDGGSATDSVSYSGMQLPVKVDLNAQADDGTAGEGDLVKTTVENVYGGFKNDVLRGSAADNELVGSLGDDTIEGRGGKDTLRSGAGADTLLAQDGKTDALQCGTEDDTFTADPSGDAIDADCNDDPPPPAKPDGTNPGNPGTNDGEDNSTPQDKQHIGPKLRIHTKRARMNGRGAVKLKVSCPATASRRCRGTLRIVRLKKGRKVTVAKRRVSVAAGRRATVRLRIGRRHRGFVAAKARRLTVVASVRDAESTSRKSSRRVRIAAARSGR